MFFSKWMRKAAAGSENLRKRECENESVCVWGGEVVCVCVCVCVCERGGGGMSPSSESLARMSPSL